MDDFSGLCRIVVEENMDQLASVNDSREIFLLLLICMQSIGHSRQLEETIIDRGQKLIWWEKMRG
jgi:hypothetical protein